MSDPVPFPASGSIWKHYKGKSYKVLGGGFLEATTEPAVIYRDADNELGPIWIRSLADWVAVVQNERRRFEPT